MLENILLSSRGAGRMAERLRDITDPAQIADISGYSPDLTLAQKVEVLETLDLEKRLRLVLGWARDTLADLTLRERVKNNVEEGIERTQREFLLRRQLEAIRKELNELDGTDDGSPDGYRAQIEELDVPDGVKTAVLREIDKLERTSEQSPEHGWIRTWLDTVFEIPWGTQTEDRLDVKEAGRILDEDHDGLKDVKERILEHLAVRKLQAERGITPVGPRGTGAILALVGPPGVGKTSLGESVARAHRTQVRPRRARRCPRRGRDPRSPPDLRRRPAGSPGPRTSRGGFDEPGAASRRGRQARVRLPRRPVVGAARGPRPCSEPHLQGPLPRGRPRPVEGAVHRDRERRGDDPDGAARPHGGHPPRRLHRGREARHRQTPPPAPPARARSAPAGRGRGDRRGPAGDLRRLHEGGRRALARARARQAAPQGRDQARGRRPATTDARTPKTAPTARGPERSPRRRRRAGRARAGSVARGSSSRRPTAPRFRVSRPGSPSPAPEATCCSSRRRRWTGPRV